MMVCKRYLLSTISILWNRFEIHPTEWGGMTPVSFWYTSEVLCTPLPPEKSIIIYIYIHLFVKIEVAYHTLPSVLTPKKTSKLPEPSDIQTFFCLFHSKSLETTEVPSSRLLQDLENLLGHKRPTAKRAKWDVLIPHLGPGEMVSIHGMFVHENHQKSTI